MASASFSQCAGSCASCVDRGVVSAGDIMRSAGCAGGHADLLAGGSLARGAGGSQAGASRQRCVAMLAKRRAIVRERRLHHHGFASHAARLHRRRCHGCSRRRRLRAQDPPGRISDVRLVVPLPARGHDGCGGAAGGRRPARTRFGRQVVVEEPAGRGQHAVPPGASRGRRMTTRCSCRQIASHAIGPALYPQPCPTTLTTDFRAVTLVVTVPNVWVANPRRRYRAAMCGPSCAMPRRRAGDAHLSPLPATAPRRI
jgi:hypothetical protein